jgi:hypothetical protein
MNYIGDFAEDATVRIVLTTNDGSGGTVAPSSAFEAADFIIYKNGSATQKTSTNGITCTSPFDSVTGLHTLEIDTSNDTGDTGFWTTGADYWVVATPDETVDSQTVIGVIATFSIQNRYSSARLAAIETDTQDIQARLPAALVSGRIDASVGAMAANVLTASALATDAVTEIQSGLSTLDAAGVRTAIGLATANLDTQLADIPTVAELNARTILAAEYATGANLAIVAGYLDTEIAAIKVTTDKLETTVELDGSVYRFTTNALEQAPSASGSTDWTSDERTAIRSILGIPGSGTTPADPTVGVLDTIRDSALDIQSRLPATLDSGNMRSSVQSMAADTLTASALAADAVAEIAAAVGGSGSGARTVTITVNDGTNALQNAKVRVTQGAESYLGTTNVSGVVTFNLDDATWTIAITKPGYTYAGTTLVVDGNESATYSMTSVTITPSSGSLVTGYWVCYSELGVVESGVSITMQVTKVPADTGFALDSAIRTSTSGSDGVAQFTNLIPGATYRVQRNSGDYYTIKIADDATGSVELNSILGT